ncbi:MAG TPA: glycosyltransferase family 9 protein, partial [Bacteroidota bacterium]
AAEILAEAELTEGQTAIGLCPSARHFTKIWPATRFAEAGAALAARRRAPVVLFGAPDEADRCREIGAEITRRTGLPAVVAAGRASLLETAALMDRCAVVVTNDTGLMHLASARRRPVVAVFGSTTRQLGFFPQGSNSRVVEHGSLGCRPCTHIGRKRCPLRHFRCMLEVAPASVIDAAESVWA